jgi:hypothetical protein
MPIAGKTIPMGDDPIVDHDSGVPAGFGSTPATGFGGTTNATSGLGTFGAVSPGQQAGFGSTSTGFGSTPASGGFGSASTAGGFGSSTGFGGGSTGFGGGGNNMGAPGASNMNMSMSNAPVLTGAGNNAAMDAEVLVKADEDWINKKWRPVMGWMYMLVCTMDFVIFPILWSLLQAFTHGNVTSQWQPVTLQGAGLFHISMGAVLGIAAYGRTKEKVAGAN